MWRSFLPTIRDINISINFNIVIGLQLLFASFLGPFMRAKICALRKLLQANRTLKRSLARVNCLHMGSQIEVQWEALCASVMWTHKWFFTRMYKQMPFQFGTFDEWSKTYSANMLSGPMNLEMLSHWTFVTENFLAREKRIQ